MVRRKNAQDLRGLFSVAEECAQHNGGSCPLIGRYGQQIAECVAHREPSGLAILSPREREIHLLLVKGQTNKMIAAHLGISQRTVEFHRANIKRKLAAKSLADLIERGRPAEIGDEPPEEG